MFATGNVRLTRDPELKKVAGGTSVCDLSVAWDSGWGDNKKPVFLDATCWAKMAETAAEHLEKGRMVNLTGELEMDTWEAQDGTRRSKHKMRITKLEFLPKPGGTGQGSPAKQEATADEMPTPF